MCHTKGHIKKQHPQGEGSKGTTLIGFYIEKNLSGLVAMGNEIKANNLEKWTLANLL